MARLKALRASIWNSAPHSSGGWSSPKDNEALKQGLPEIQLYDMAADIGEQNNLAAEYPEKTEEMKSLMYEIINREQ